MCKHLTEIIKLNIDEHDIEQDLSDLTAIVDAPKEQPVFTAASVNVRNDEFEAQKVKLFEKLKEARVKRKSKKSKNLLEDILLCPEKLVACYIKHKVQETEDDIPEWFNGMVLKIEKINTKFPSKTLFKVQYGVDGESVFYDFPFLAELKKGNHFCWSSFGNNLSFKKYKIGKHFWLFM